MNDVTSARLKEARIAAGFASAEAACNAFGWKPAAYRHHEGGVRAFDRDTAIQYGKAYKVNPGWLLGLDGYRTKAELAAAVPLATAKAASDHLPTRSVHHEDGAIEVRQVDLAYAMGPGTNVDDYPEETPVKFDPNFLRILTRAPADRLFVARGDGDSMSPTLINDDMVMIDTTQRMLNMQDRIWAVSVYGAGMIKRLRAVSEGRVMVLSDNPAIPEQEVGAEDLHIVGRVIWVGRRV
jgi:phage repressor protein C with HTH and peptisase S24 domain